MPEKSKWQNKCFNTSFDDPTKKCEKTKNESPQQPSGILSILGKNIGLLSRKHNRLAQRKYQPGPAAEKTENKIKISNLLKFPKTKENKINSSPAQTNPGDKKKISSASDNSQTKRQTKRSKSSKSKESNNEFNVDKTACDESKCKTKNISAQKKKFRQHEAQKCNNIKANNIEQKLQKSKIRKSKSDSALNEKKRRPLRVTSAQSNVSNRPSSGSGSATTRTSTSSFSSSKSGTPNVKKKAKKPLEKNKKKEESSSNPLAEQPVVYVNYRYQVRD